MLDQLQGHDVRGSSRGDRQHVVRREHALVRHQRHRRPGAEAREAGHVPRRQRLLDQLDPHLAQGGQAAVRHRLVPGLVGVDDQAGTTLERVGQTAQSGEIGFGRLRADLDLEGIVQAGRQLPFRLLDLLRRVTGGERPQDGYAVAHGSAEQSHRRQAQGPPDGIDQGRLQCRLGRVVAFGRPVHQRARLLETVGGRADQRRRKVGIDRGLDALDALLAPARPSQRGGLADPLRLRWRDGRVRSRSSAR